jgi:hypothetical protein
MREAIAPVLSLDPFLDAKLYAANKAVIEFLVAARDSDDPLLPMICGLSQEAFRAWTATKIGSVHSILQCGLPLFEMRLKSPQSVALLSENHISHDAVVAELSATFPKIEPWSDGEDTNEVIP